MNSWMLNKPVVVAKNFPQFTALVMTSSIMKGLLTLGAAGWHLSSWEQLALQKAGVVKKAFPQVNGSPSQGKTCPHPVFTVLLLVLVKLWVEPELFSTASQVLSQGTKCVSPPGPTSQRDEPSGRMDLAVSFCPVTLFF